MAKNTSIPFMSDYNSKIAYQGEPGAYSYLACKTVYPELEPVPYESFAAAFAAVENRETLLAMIPIENSLGGRVADIHHLIPESQLYIIDEHYQPVTHCLLGVKGASIDQLTHVRSHPQGLAQCLAIFDELKVKPVTSTDTAGSAREVRDLNDPTQGAIASALAGEIYGLDVLREQVEDRVGNTTRFIILSDTPAEPDPEEGPCMTSFTFKVRSVPAALYKSLGGFATCGVNLTKLESYIMDEHFQVAQFYAEIEGHPSEKMVETAFEELKFYSTTLKILGTYPANPYRTKKPDQ